MLFTHCLLGKLSSIEHHHQDMHGRRQQMLQGSISGRCQPWLRQGSMQRSSRCHEFDVERMMFMLYLWQVDANSVMANVCCEKDLCNSAYTSTFAVSTIFMMLGALFIARM
jgi:hypothetical protein